MVMLVIAGAILTAIAVLIICYQDYIRRWFRKQIHARRRAKARSSVRSKTG